MKSFKSFMSEAVARRPDKITVESLHQSGRFTPDETGHINITTYHGGHLGEDENSPLSVKSIIFPNFSDNIFIARPKNMGQLIQNNKMHFTRNQPYGSDYGFSTTPDALTASMYRVGTYRGYLPPDRSKNAERTYEINLKVHKNNIKHFRTWHDMNMFLGGNHESSPFSPENPRHQEYREFAASHPVYGHILKEMHRLKDAHTKMIADHEENFKKVDTGNRVSFAEWQQEGKRKIDNNDLNFTFNQIHEYQEEMRIEKNKRFLDHMDSLKKSKPFKDIVSEFHKHNDSLPRNIHNQINSRFLSDRMGLHVLTSRDGSATAVHAGEIMILHPSVISSVHDVTDDINNVRDRYYRATGHRLFKPAQQITKNKL